MKQPIYRFLIELTNGRITSYLLQKFARSKLSRFVIPSFSKTYKINEQEMEKERKEYQSLHDFFIRKLKTNARITHAAEESVVSPVDAVIEDIGMIESTREIVVKGKTYSISEMLGSKEKADVYAGGEYMILYLSPSHYHRIHSPVTGTVLEQWTLGRKSYPVNRLGLKYGRDTLSKNYRTITEIQHEEGKLAVIKVGAMFVNSIETTHNGDMLEKGKEMAYFTFGSTVILLFEKDTFILDQGIKAPFNIQAGKRIGDIVHQSVQV
ncbi:phosphatidylserine decarboxylase [Cytobacillus gottheilii]|uniref:phosphatidylserine decarboxylase n=1 Tax=Cytobacillus gottheilii TaxID=859144 RepID=UPI00082A39EB|nr:phosphatidylserine decarboxylase [Cytobacillus gottheilii]